MLTNLLDNAVKFSPAGATVRLEAEAAAGGLRVRISDQGLGIPSAELSQVFGRFFRASNAIREEVPGTGVGLYIAKAIIDKAGGRITVDSELGAGTTFEVWLPGEESR